MSIQKINMSAVQPAFRANDEVKKEETATTTTPETETEKPDHTVRNWSIGLGAAAVLIGLGVAGRKGHLGKGLQKLLGGKSANTAEHVAGDAATAGTKAGDGAAAASEHAAAEIKAGEEAASATESTAAEVVKTEEKAGAQVAEDTNAVVKETEKGAENAAKDTEETVAKTTEEAAPATETVVAKDTEETVAKTTEEVPPATETVAAKETDNAAAKEAEEAARKAEAKAAREAAQKAYDEEMQARLAPQAKELIKDLQGAWGEEAARATRLYEKAEVEGFSSLKGVADALEDGTHRITFTTPSGVKYEYLSKHGDVLDEIRVFGKDNELSHVAEFYRAKESTPVVDIFKKTGDFYEGSLSSAHVNFESDHIAFEMSRKNPRFLEWGTHGVFEPEKIIHIQPGFGKYSVSYTGNDAKDVLGNSFWIEP